MNRQGPLAATAGVEVSRFFLLPSSFHQDKYIVFCSFQAVAFLPSSYANESWPDLQLTFVSNHAGYDGGNTYRYYLGIKEGVGNMK